jgi:hypothetical protein
MGGIIIAIYSMIAAAFNCVPEYSSSFGVNFFTCLIKSCMLIRSLLINLELLDDVCYCHMIDFKKSISTILCT